MRDPPIVFHSDKTRRLRTITLHGIVGDHDVLAVSSQLLADPAHDPAMDDLIDMRSVERLDVSSETVRRVAGIFIDAGDAPSGRLAIVAPRDDLFGMARMYQSLRPDRLESRVFRNYDEALLWLTRRA